MDYYKYLTCDTAFAVLRSRQLRWSAPVLLNDPYDIQFDLHNDVDRVVVRARALKKLWDMHYGDHVPEQPNQLGQISWLFAGDFRAYHAKNSTDSSDPR